MPTRTIADLDYLLPLFHLAEQMEGDDHTFALAEAPVGSTLELDDNGLDGYYVSHRASFALTSSLEHVRAMRALAESGSVAAGPLWSLTRGVLEPAAAGLWLLSPSTREARRRRTLKLWRHDMGQLADWRKGTQRKGKDHVAAIDDLAMSLGMGTLGKVKYSVIVRQAGDKTPVGGARALTHWRECSAFAHGSYWGSLFLNDNTFVEELRGGAAFRSALDEKVHAKACATALMVLQAGVDSWERHTRPTA